MFLFYLLNKQWKLTRNNIGEETKTLCEILDYFGSWNAERTEVDINEKLTAAQSSKYYIAYQTYDNLLTLVRGFLGYAWYILHSSDVEKFVPALHCNQSSLEGSFP